MSNWSGSTVLAASYHEVPVELVKSSLNLQDYDIWRPGVFGVIHGLRRKSRQLVESDIFNAFIIISVLFNTVILASTGLVKDSKTTAVFSAFNTLFTVVFCLEMAIKIFGLGPLSISFIFIIALTFPSICKR